MTSFSPYIEFACSYDLNEIEKEYNIFINEIIPKNIKEINQVKPFFFIINNNINNNRILVILY
jgi:hypothetical protein